MDIKRYSWAFKSGTENFLGPSHFLHSDKTYVIFFLKMYTQCLNPLWLFPESQHDEIVNF